MIAGAFLTSRQIARQPSFGFAAFAPQVGFELDDGPSEKGVDSSVHFGNRLLEIDLPARGAQPFDEQSVEQSAHFLVAGPGSQLGNRFVQRFHHAVFHRRFVTV